MAGRHSDGARADVSPPDAARAGAVARPLADAPGVVAGAAFALLPCVIRYAQEARSYAIVTMLAAVTTYLLLQAFCAGGRWWLGYGAAAALTGLFNIFGLLILIAHGVSALVAARGLPRPAGLSGRRLAGVPARWVLAGAGAVVALIPIAAFAYPQRAALAWPSPRADKLRIVFVGQAVERKGLPLLLRPHRANPGPRRHRDQHPRLPSAPHGSAPLPRSITNSHQITVGLSPTRRWG